VGVYPYVDLERVRYHAVPVAAGHRFETDGVGYSRFWPSWVPWGTGFVRPGHLPRAEIPPGADA
jgi:hypothetical protein